MFKYLIIFCQKKRSKSFTLIELLVVIAIIGILSSIVLVSLNSAKARARDAKRKHDLVQFRSALEMYYIDHGSYPLPYPVGSWGGVSTVGCNSANGTTSGSNAYITGLTPSYISVLPVDPGPAGSCNGYLYYSTGADYKLLVNGSAESYPKVGQMFYDPARPTSAWMICSREPVCSTW